MRQNMYEYKYQYMFQNLYEYKHQYMFQNKYQVTYQDMFLTWCLRSVKTSNKIFEWTMHQIQKRYDDINNWRLFTSLLVANLSRSVPLELDAMHFEGANSFHHNIIPDDFIIHAVIIAIPTCCLHESHDPGRLFQVLNLLQFSCWQ